MAAGQLLILDQEMKHVASKLGVPAIVLKADDLERKALTIIPIETPKVKESGYNGYRQFMPTMTREQSAAAYRDIANTGELERLCNGRHNAFQIKQMLDTQYPKESSLKAILDYIEILKGAGLVTLTSVKKSNE